MSTSSSTREFADGFSCVIFKDNKPETVTDTTDDQFIEQPKPKKKKNRGVKKGKGSKTKLSTTNNTDTQAAGATAVQVDNDNTAVPAAPPLSKTAKNKLRAQNKADRAAKTARATQIAAAAKAKKMGVSVTTDENASPSVDITSMAKDVSSEVTISSFFDDGEGFEATDSSSDVADTSVSGDIDSTSSTEASEEPLATDASQDFVDSSLAGTGPPSPADATDPTDTLDSASVVEDVVSASGDVDEPSKSTPFDTSENATFGFGNNVTFDFGHDSSFETGNVAISGVLQPINITEALLNFGQAFSPMPPAPRRVLSLEISNTAFFGSNSGVGATPLPPKVRKATSFASSVRKHQAQQGKLPILDGSKTPRDVVPVKLNRKPLSESAKKDHQEPNPFLQTLIKKSSTNPVCAEAAFNLQHKFGATIPRKPLKKASKPIAIEYYAPVNGDSAGKVLEIDDVQDEDMPDAVSVTDSEITGDEAVAPHITEFEDAPQAVDAVEPVIDIPEPAPALAEQADEFISEDIGSDPSEDEQQDGFIVQDTIEIEEQASQGDVDEDIIDEQVTSPPSSAPLPADDIVVETPLVNNTASILVAKSQLDFLSFPNAAEYLPVLSCDTVQALIDAHVTPLHLQELPGAVKKLTRAEKKAAKIASAIQVVVSPSAAPNKSELKFLSFLDAAEYPAVLSRDEAQVVVNLHVTPLHQQQVPGNEVKPASAENKAAKKASKKAAKAEKKALAKQTAMGTSEAAQQPTELPCIEQDISEVSHTDETTSEAVEDTTSPIPAVDSEAPEVAVADESTPDQVGEDTSSPIHGHVSEHGLDSSSPQSKETAKLTSTHTSKELLAIKMCNTYLGITSLADLIEALNISPTNTVTKNDLCTAFSTCAAAEYKALLNRSPAHIDNNFSSTITLGRTKLGKTSLLNFLQAVKWVENVGSLREIMRVFEEKATEGDEISDKVFEAAELHGDV